MFVFKYYGTADERRQFCREQKIGQRSAATLARAQARASARDGASINADENAKNSNLPVLFAFICVYLRFQKFIMIPL
jgi:hypothetical protein